MVNPLMRGGATPTSWSPQWTFMMGGYPVGSRATFTWLDASVPVRRSRRHHLVSSAMGTRPDAFSGR